MHLALEEGCLKAGQRYWACFALRQVASRLSADSMRRVLASDAQHSPRVEDGAVLLVGFHLPEKTAFTLLLWIHAHPMHDQVQWCRRRCSLLRSLTDARRYSQSLLRYLFSLQLPGGPP